MSGRAGYGLGTEYAELSGRKGEDSGAERRETVDEQSIVGAELLVIKNGRTIFRASYGLSDLEAGVPMENGAIFNIRSMTKPIVGFALQTLIEEGDLGVDDRISTHLPAFDTEDPSLSTPH